MENWYEQMKDALTDHDALQVLILTQYSLTDECIDHNRIELLMECARKEFNPESPIFRALHDFVQNGLKRNSTLPILPDDREKVSKNS